MNERIKALMGQTLDEKFAGTWSTMDLLDLQKFAERFTELIVQECASLMNAEKEYYSKPGTYESLEIYDRMATKENAFEDAASIIKSRFGVEE